MTYIPPFTSEEHKEEYYQLYAEYLDTFAELLEGTAAAFFPDYEIDRLQPKTLEVLNDITRSLIYDVNDRFEKKYPEYKEESDIFVPRTAIKDAVKEALGEFKEDT